MKDFQLGNKDKQGNVTLRYDHIRTCYVYFLPSVHCHLFDFSNTLAHRCMRVK